MISVSLSKLKINLRNEAGFSLLSLVFLILVLSFAGIAITVVLLPSALTRQSRETVDRAAELRVGILAYAFSHGGIGGTHAPSLDALVTTDGVACAMDLVPTDTTYLTLQGWCGPYVDQSILQSLSNFKTDGWGTLFNYASGTTVITSCGPNRTCGDSDDITFNP
jgi:type II secretory pathway pseudopilin PulG